MNGKLLEYNPDLDAFDNRARAPRWAGTSTGSHGEAAFSDAESMEFAVRLLEVSSEAELESVVGALVRRALRTAGRQASDQVAATMVHVLKPAAKRILPAICGHANRFAALANVGPIGVDAAAAGRIFGLELEGLSPEDQEFESARAFVQFAGEAARRAGTAAARGSPPTAAARLAATEAARRYAPGWLHVDRDTRLGSAVPRGQRQTKRDGENDLLND
jgi:hypothetical protein